MKLLVSHNGQTRAEAAFRSHNGAFVEALMVMRRVTYLSGGLPGVLLALGSADVYMYGGWRVITEQITIGQAPVDVVEPAAPVPLDDCDGAIELAHVTFTFDRATVLDDVSLTIALREWVAIVGESGVGKSTIADLLVRHADPAQGVVRLDGHDVHTLALATVRRHVLVVETDAFVFRALLASNLRPAPGD